MRVLRKILGGISLTAAMFVFQACYGTMESENYDDFTIRVVDAEHGLPMQDVTVESQRVKATDNHEALDDWRLRGQTDSAGIVNTYYYLSGTEFDRFRFTAPDASYAVFDTVVDTWTDTLNIVLVRVN